jgi:hypothetical protein
MSIQGLNYSQFCDGKLLRTQVHNSYLIMLSHAKHMLNSKSKKN